MSESLAALIEHIYDAALDDEALQRLPGDFAATVNARSCTIQHSQPDGAVELLAFNHFGPELLAQYVRHYAAEDQWAQLLMTHGQDRMLAIDRHFSLKDFRRTPLHNEFAVPNGLHEVSHCMGTVVMLPGGGMGICGIQRDAQAGAFGVEDERLMQQVVPHFKRLMLLRTRLAGAERKAELADAMFDHLPVGVLLLNANGEVGYANAVAAALLRNGDGLSWSVGRHVGAENRAEGVRLRTLAARAADGARGGALLLQRSSGATALQVLVAPFRPPGALPARKALVLVHDPMTQPQELGQTLMQLFDLSAGEARVAVALAEGSSLVEIAEEHGVKTSTVQTQLKRALEKTGQRRQSGLVKVVSQVPVLRKP